MDVLRKVGLDLAAYVVGIFANLAFGFFIIELEKKATGDPIVIDAAFRLHTYRVSDAAGFGTLFLCPLSWAGIALIQIPQAVLASLVLLERWWERRREIQEKK